MDPINRAIFAVDLALIGLLGSVFVVGQAIKALYVSFVRECILIRASLERPQFQRVDRVSKRNEK